MHPARVGMWSALLALCALCGCRHAVPVEERPTPTGNAPVVRPADLTQHLRNNAASLLYQLLNDEKHLSKLLLVKVESDPLDDLVTEISTFAARGAGKLEELAKSDRTLSLEATGLPSGEVAVREAVAKTKMREMIGSKGDEFEFRLLLSQIEALNYAAHLAKVAAENESRPEHARVFSELSAGLKRLQERTVGLLKAR